MASTPPQPAVRAPQLVVTRVSQSRAIRVARAPEVTEGVRRAPAVMRVIQREARTTSETRWPRIVVAPNQANANRDRVFQEIPMVTRSRSRRMPKPKGASGTLKKLAAKEEIIKSLECPVCYSIPIPPIIHCKGGHVTCGPCRSKLENCGLCKKPFSSTRNYPVEAIINSCHFNCPYDEDGCTEEIKGEVYTHHSNICHFRNIICTETRHKACEFESVPYRSYWQHLKDVHYLKTKVVFFDDYTFLDLTIPTASATTTSSKDVTSNDKYCIEIANTNHKFILKGVYSNRSFKFWIGYFGTPMERIPFKATVCVGSVCNSESKISWTMSVSSFRKSLDELEEVGTVKDSFMKRITKNCDDGVYKIQLFCKIENTENTGQAHSP